MRKEMYTTPKIRILWNLSFLAIALTYERYRITHESRTDPITDCLAFLFCFKNQIKLISSNVNNFSVTINQ